MSFLQPFILWGLPLLLVPIIIHLLNRLRHRPQPWAAMQFLRAANQSSISQAKLRQILVLLLRVLGVAALILFLSRPLAGGWLGWALSPAPEVIVLVLDRSASMEAQAQNSGKSRREEAIRLWSDALRPFQQSSRFVLLDSATQTAQELPNLTALAQPIFSGPTDTRADIPTLLQRAYSYLSESRSGGAEVWIASDLQESNWQPNDAQWERVTAQFAALPQKVRFRLLSFEPSRKNVSLSLVEAVRRSRNGQRQLSLALDLQESEPTGDSVVLRWNIAGSASQADLKLTGQALRWRNQFPLPAANEPGWGSIEIGADANAADNKVYFAYDVERTPTALIVSTHPGSARALQLAAADLSKAVVERAKVVSPEDFAGLPLTNVALVVWQSGALNNPSAGFLQEFVGSGGALVFLPDSANPVSFAGLGFGEVTPAKTNSVFHVAKWNELEGPLAKTEEGFGVPLRELEVFQRMAIAGDGGLLGSFEDGAPFLVRKALGKGEVYFCATSTDPGWSTFSDGSVLVPMLQRMLSTGARRVNTGVMTDCNAVNPREISDWSRVDRTEGKSDPRLQAGVYRAAGRFVAVNRPSQENDLQRISPDLARKLFATLPFRMHEEKSGGGDRLQGEVWRFFVGLMLVFLMLEGLLILPPKPERPVAEVKPTARRRPEEVPA